MFTAATAMTDGENPLIAQAEQIGKPQDSSRTDSTTREPDNGSFERFMHTFGAPHRWGGA